MNDTSRVTSHAPSSDAGRVRTHLEQQLERRLGSVLGSGTRVTGLRQVPGGASRQTWALSVQTPDGGTRPLILRRDPPSEPRPDEMAREAVALRAARRHGVPVPELIDAGTESDVLGAPYLLMTFVPGETIARKILRDASYTSARTALAAQLGRAAAAIHRVPTAELVGLPRQDVLGVLRQRYAETGVLRPVIELAFAWLGAHRPPPTTHPVLVHGDLRLGNVIVDEGGLAAVLDWELVHLGDPMEDLGYLCIRAWRFGGPLPVAGVGTFDDLFLAYEEAGGVRPDPEVVFWWQVAGTLSWAIGCLVQADRHFSGATRSVELAAIGRRVTEQEHDLLRMLHPEVTTGASGASDSDSESAGPSTLHTFPDAVEIVAAVREFLRDEVMPSTAGTLSFHSRVAANLLDVLARELERGPAGESRYLEALAGLGCADEAQLALRVRDGRLGPDDPGLAEALWTITRDRLAVANPAHLHDDVPDDPRVVLR